MQTATSVRRSPSSVASDQNQPTSQALEPPTRRYSPRARRTAHPQVPAGGSLLAAPLLAAALAADTLPVSLTFLLVEYLAAECWLGPTVAGIYAALPSQSTRGTAQVRPLPS